MTVLFIAGQGRSGSTLLERMLAELPSVTALGEACYVWQDRLHRSERCGCGEMFADCPFWTAVGERAFDGWDRAELHRMAELWATLAWTRRLPLLVRPRPQRRAAAIEFATRHARILSAAAEVSGDRVIIDSSKYPAVAYCLRWLPDLDLRVVHLVRDPRGVAYSWTKHVRRPETDGATLVPQYHPARSAMRWNAHNAAVHVLARMGASGDGSGRRVPVLRIRYEDFMADPRRTVISVARFAGLDPQPSDLDFLTDDSVRLGVIHSASGNPMRFTTGVLSLRRDDAWRDRLPAGQRRLVSALCAPALAAYGYPVLVRPSTERPTDP